MASANGNDPKKRNQGETSKKNIDNTAPVDEIIENFKLRHKRAYSFYYFTITQRNSSKKAFVNLHYLAPAHPLFAFSEDWDGDAPSDYFESFKYKCSLPKMITPIENIDKQDPLTKLLAAKSKWINELYSQRRNCSRIQIASKYEVIDENLVQCPKMLVDLAATVESDPDPLFSTWNYNWHYSGNGNLQLVCVDYVDYLLHSKFTSVYLTQFFQDTIQIKNEHAATFDCGDDKNILETICSNENIIALRTKYRIFILKIVTIEDGPSLEKLKEMDSQMMFTGINFDTYHKNILYATTLDCNLYIINVDRMTKRSIKLKGDVGSLADNWNTVLNCERAHYLHVTRAAITAYDKRTNGAVNTWKELRNITDDMDCHDIGVVKQREGTKTLYLASEHNLFLMDLRGKPKPVYRWAHGMQCMPTYMSTCNFKLNKELVSLSSQWCEDMCVVQHYTEISDRVSGVSIPYRPPSIFNTLSEARNNILCYDLYNPIDGRLCTAVSGNVLFEQGEKYVVLLQNSLGDISAHVLFPEHLSILIEDDAIESLDQWRKGYVTKKENLEMSYVFDISKLWRKLKRFPKKNKLQMNMSEPQHNFDEKESHEGFENEELDDGILELWQQQDDTALGYTFDTE